MKFKIVKEIDCTHEEAWSLISDLNGSPVNGVSQSIVRYGNASGVGTIRMVKMGRNTYIERIDDVEPGKSISYSIISGAQVKWYKGKGIIISSERTVKIEWSAEFEAIFPVPNFIVEFIAKRNVIRYLCAVSETLKSKH